MLDLTLHMIPHWLGIDITKMKDGIIPGFKIGDLVHFIPEHFLNNAC